MSEITCDSEGCDATTFKIAELCWGNLTLVCDECKNEMPLADDGRVYADFGSGGEKYD